MPSVALSNGAGSPRDRDRDFIRPASAGKNPVPCNILFLGSSVVEPSAVNGLVGSSNLSLGANCKKMRSMLL